MIRTLFRRLLDRIIGPRIEEPVEPESTLLQMPLASSINSDTVEAPFLAGKNTQIMSGAFITDDSRVGGHTYIGFHCFITRATIGRYVSIANNVAIGMGEHNYNSVSTSTAFVDAAYDELTKADCTIGHDVWIGNGAVIRRGVTVGNGAVIGALSFVNKDVPPFAIVAGIPAKIIKYRFDEATIKAIEESGWWDKDAEEAKSIISSLEKNIKQNHQLHNHINNK